MKTSSFTFFLLTYVTSLLRTGTRISILIKQFCKEGVPEMMANGVGSTSITPNREDVFAVQRASYTLLTTAC